MDDLATFNAKRKARKLREEQRCEQESDLAPTATNGFQKQFNQVVAGSNRLNNDSSSQNAWNNNTTKSMLSPQFQQSLSISKHSIDPNDHTYPKKMKSQKAINGNIPVYDLECVFEYVKHRSILPIEDQSIDYSYYVVKSYTEKDVFVAIKHGVWCSTAGGNIKLHEAFNKSYGNVILLFSVNGSRQFCGIAKMTSNVDFNKSAGIWCKSTWCGCFDIQWLMVKDVPQSYLRHLKFVDEKEKCERSIDRARDCTLLPTKSGEEAVKVMKDYNSSTCIFDDKEHYEQEEVALSSN